VQRYDRSLSPSQLSRALGVGESTIKRWIDQGRIPAEKTPGGHRRIRLSDAVDLMRRGGLSWVNAAALGFSPCDEASPATLTALLCSPQPDAAVGLVHSLYASGLGAAELADQWIAPAMHHVGHGWAAGSVTITEEHRATAVMLRAMHGLLDAQPAPRAGAPRAFVAGLAQDPYLLAPLCAQLVVGEAGFATTNYGPDTPPDSLLDAVRSERPALVAVSFSVPETTGSRGRAALGTACRDAGSALVVGGRALRPDLVDDLCATAWCRSMTELDRIARHLAAHAAAHDLAPTG